MKTSRRNILKAMLAMGFTGYAAPYINTFAQSKKTIDINNFIPVTPEQVNLKVFKELSKLVTFQDYLDDNTTKKMYNVFVKEPWGKEHISQVYNKLARAITEPKKPVEELNEGENWFVDHLITTWYLGIYYHEKIPDQRITFEHALMYQIVKDIVPTPFLGAEGFNTWENPPKKEQI